MNEVTRNVLIVLTERVERIPVAVRVGAALAYVALVAAVDVWTGPDVTISFSYAIAGMATAWTVGWRAGLAVIAVANLVGFAVNVAAERQADVSVIVINHGLRLVSFVVLVTLTVGARSSISSLLTTTRIDPMTGVLNKHGFLDALARVRRVAQRTGEPLAVVYFDLDGLKLVNDRDGHAAGDDLIRRFTDRVGRHLRTSDPFGRLGGDEFALVLDRADPDAIDVVVGRILDDPGLPEVSCGVAVFHGRYPSPEAMLDGADRRMFEDKRFRRGSGASR